MAGQALTLDDLDATKACAQAFEFEYINEQGNPSGIWFSVYGGESEIVQQASAKLQNERRRRQAQREIQQRIGTAGQKKVEFDLFEEDIEQGKRIAAARLAGWRGAGEVDGLTDEEKARFCGIAAPFNAENALRLCRSNVHIAAQITQQSEESANFIKL